MPHPRTTNFSALLSATAEVCLRPAAQPKAPKRPRLGPITATAKPQGADNTETLKPSEWAKKCLNFEPSPKQAVLLDADAKYLILCCNRQWGKTTAIAIKALHRAVHIPGQSIVIISRTKVQAGLLIEKAIAFAIGLGFRTRRVLGQSYSLQLPNGSRIVAVPHTQDSSLGRTANVLIVDEAAAVKDEVYFSVSPFVGRTHGQIWLVSTPSRQAGFFYNFWHEESTRWHKIFSPVADCPEIDPDFLDMQKRADPIKFQQDFLCLFVQPANRLVTREFARSILRRPDRHN